MASDENTPTILKPGANESSSVTILSRGATIQSLQIAGSNIALSLPSPELYLHHNASYFGETIGRVANRIAGAKLHDLNGQDYPLFANNGSNCLHGGKEGWGKKIWTGPTRETRDDGSEAYRWDYTSQHMDEGFPAAVKASTWYSVKAHGEAGLVLDVEYEAAPLPGESRETVVALTNHSYFNVTNGVNTAGTRCTIYTDLHLPTDGNQIPTGEIGRFPGIPVAGEEFLFTEDAPKIDHCMIIDTDPASIPLDTRSRPLHPLITLSSDDSGITLHVESTEPAFQIFTGDGINVPSFREGSEPLGDRAGMAIEPSRFVNAAGKKEWRNMVLLKPGTPGQEIFGAKTRYTVTKKA